MDELIKKIEEHKVYVESFKTYMIPFTAVERLIRENYNNNLANTFKSIEEELQKVSSTLNNININD